MQEYLRAELIRMSTEPDLDEWVLRVSEQRARYGVKLSAEEILEHLHADRK